MVWEQRGWMGGGDRVIGRRHRVKLDQRRKHIGSDMPEPLHRLGRQPGHRGLGGKLLALDQFTHLAERFAQDFRRPG